MSFAEHTHKIKKRTRNGTDASHQQPEQHDTHTPKHRTYRALNQGASRNISTTRLKKQKQALKQAQKQPTTQQPLKLPRLPDHAAISKRPLHRPALPTPFSSSDSPKIFYVKTSSSFVPAIKRIRSLLSQTLARDRQSLYAISGRQETLLANGRLDPLQVERSIAKAAGEKEVDGREEVYVKASGKAIEHALEIGVYFQKEGDCRVRVEIGSVKAVDDIELGEKAVEEVALEGEGGGEEMDLDQSEVNKKDRSEYKRKMKKRKSLRDEHVPETRIRTLSVVTVAISLR